MQCVGGARSNFSEGSESKFSEVSEVEDYQMQNPEGAVQSKGHPATPLDMELRKTFEEIKEKAQHVMVQRRKAEVFQITYGPW